jgi:hypothetical protein
MIIIGIIARVSIFAIGTVLEKIYVVLEKILKHLSRRFWRIIHLDEE